MGFEYPAAFYSIVILPLVLWILWKGINYTGLISSLYKSDSPTGFYKTIKTTAVVIIFLCLVLVGARPYLEPRTTADYIFLTDISRSMTARNYCSEPSFLDRSKEVMREILENVPEGRFGMFAFARLAFPISQMTFNHHYLHDVIDKGLGVGMIFEATATGITNGLSVVAQKKTNFPEIYGNVEYIILFSDGFMEGDWRNDLTQSLADIRQAGIKVITVGIGNPGETPIPRQVNGECVDDYLQSGGRPLRIPLQDDLLKFIATETGGDYFGEGTINELITFLRENTLKPALENTPFTEQQRRDISGGFLLTTTLALLVFLLL
jgi:Ca-activated chloride channel family protein